LDYVEFIDHSVGQQHTPLNIDRGYNFGYFLGAGYMISERYDVQASWTQLDADNNDSAISCDTCHAVTSNQMYLGATPPDEATTEESLNYQAFDATLGQYHKLSDKLMTRVFAGVRYAKIDNNTENEYFLSNGETRNDNYDSSFSGVGPEAGLDMNYEVYDWFGIVGHFAAAFLIGELESDSAVFDGNKNIEATVDSDNVTRMVPALDAKLGVNLSVPFMDNKDRFVIEAGYQVDYYFDVVDQIQASLDLEDELDGGPTGTVHNYANVGFMGPYLNVSVKF
jgi:hypothetical protein